MLRNSRDGATEHSVGTLLGSRLEKQHSKEMALGKWGEVRCAHILETAEVWLAVPGAVAVRG